MQNGIWVASLILAFGFASVEFSEAKPKNQGSNTCEAKNSACVGRCNKRYAEVKDVIACIWRTCEHQRRNCENAQRAQ